jgi:hypothetical protein
MGMIKKIKSVIKNIIPKKKKTISDIEKLEASAFKASFGHFTQGYGWLGKSSNYIGVPAPTVLPDDPWFGSAPKSQKAIQHEEKVATESKIKEEQRKETTQESKNIHQVMYEMATKNWNTVKETQGGSENFQENHGGWNSGTGMGQYR